MVMRFLGWQWQKGNMISGMMYLILSDSTNRIFNTFMLCNGIFLDGAIFIENSWFLCTCKKKLYRNHSICWELWLVKQLRMAWSRLQVYHACNTWDVSDWRLKWRDWAICQTKVSCKTLGAYFVPSQGIKGYACFLTARSVFFFFFLKFWITSRKQDFVEWI